MTNIQNIIKEKIEKEKKVNEEKLAIANASMSKQISNMIEISDTKGFLEIKKFWQLKYDIALNELKNAKMSDLQQFGRIQERLYLSDSFLKFLNIGE